MNRIFRSMTNICSDDLPKSKDFYTRLFDFGVEYDSDWFIHLKSKDNQFELGIIDGQHDLVPAEYRSLPRGFYITFVVEDADEVYKKAKSAGFPIVREPEDTFYGQRRVLLRDPSDALVDVSSLMKNVSQPVQ